MSCMLTDQYWFYVFCQREGSSEAGPIRARGCKEGETTPPPLGPKGLTSNNKPKELVCLKHKRNNHKKKGLRGDCRWIVVYVSFVLATMAQAQEPGGHEATECSFRKQPLPIQPGGLSSNIMHQLIPRARGVMGETWRQVTKSNRLPAGHLLRPVSAQCPGAGMVTSLHGASDPAPFGAGYPQCPALLTRC